jgi:hypothetical protein
MASDENKNPNGCTGPRSPEGKITSSQNSLKHGLCSDKLILPNEDPAEFDAIKEKWLSDCVFDEPLLCDLAGQVAVAEWFHRRALREYNHVRLHVYELQPDCIFWTADQIKLIERFQRYLTTRERAFNRAVANYQAFFHECRRAHERANKLREEMYELVKLDPDLSADFIERTQDLIELPRRYVARLLQHHPLCPDPGAGSIEPPPEPSA